MLDDDGTYQYSGMSYVKNGEPAVEADTTETEVNEIALTDTDDNLAEAEVDFTNVYVRNITAELEATKSFNAWHDDISFKFIMRPVEGESGNPMPAGSNGKVEAIATEELKSVSFGEITYTLSDLDGQASKEFKYSIYEEIPADAVNEHGVTYEYRDKDENDGIDEGPWVKDGIKYDDHVYTATVAITKTGNELTSNVTYDFSNGDIKLAPIFKNKYEVSNKTQFFAKKILKGRDSFKDGDFSFILKGDRLVTDAPTYEAESERLRLLHYDRLEGKNWSAGFTN